MIDIRPDDLRPSAQEDPSDGLVSIALKTLTKPVSEVRDYDERGLATMDTWALALVDAAGISGNWQSLAGHLSLIQRELDRCSLQASLAAKNKSG